MNDETTLEGLESRDVEDVKNLKLEIDEINALLSFGNSEVGKRLVAERESQVINIINKLISSLRKPEDQTIQFYISQIAQLKISIRDLVDFKGSKNSLEDRQILLDTILKRKG